jgi:hypothetical protein
MRPYPNASESRSELSSPEKMPALYQSSLIRFLGCGETSSTALKKHVATTKEGAIMFARIRARFRSRASIALLDLRRNRDFAPVIETQPIGQPLDRGSHKNLALPSAFAAMPWQMVLGGTLIMLVATMVVLQARPMLWPLPMVETRIPPQSLAYQHTVEDALRMAVDRLDRFNRETALYRDPNAEVFIPGFGYGSPNAMRLQIQDQVEARRADHERLQHSVHIARAAAP